MQINSLFPIPVGQFKLPVLTKKQKSYIINQPTNKNVGNRISKNKFLLNDKIMSHVKKQIEKFLMEYSKEIISHPDNCKLIITQSWCNYAGLNESHHRHTHPNSIVSGVYYPQTNKEDKIFFYNDRMTRSVLKVDKLVYNSFNSSSWWIPTEENSLILFPSDLEHSVENRATNGPDRISLSFNTFYTGEIGNHDHSTFLSLP
tara:strand:- start:63 stop:668 length:606 start_codon:yes stop_codon:yes gene_type:complete